MATILLATLNARYAHASMGLRCLRANLGELRDQSEIVEFVIGTRTETIVEAILARQPAVVGLGVYIWNVEETTRVVAMLKTVAPHIKLVLGGPEVSYETEAQRICQLADYVVTGWGDVTFPKLCAQILVGPQPLMKIHAGEQPPLDSLAMPYDEYTDEDVARRTIYVEASRGCPFKCEFCLSALDKTAWPFALEPFLAAMDGLYQRGVRRFKFVDRTFNLNIKVSNAILKFFLSRIQAAPDDPCFVHFELVPDHLPDALKSVIAEFPDGTLQFEIGIQTFNTEVQQRISRKQDNDRAAMNLDWLVKHSRAHLHVDLIAGLPGENVESFGAGFDRLHALAPHEIQFGILKRLRGTPIIRHTQQHAMRYNPDPPYNILATDVISFTDMQRLVRFARYWDLVANSGRFARTLPLLLRDAPFAEFLAFADWLHAKTAQTHNIALERLFDLVGEFLAARSAGALLQAAHASLQDAQASPQDATASLQDAHASPQDAQASLQDAHQQALSDDYAATGAHGRIAGMKRGNTVSARGAPSHTPARQARHLLPQ
jgi:radical SAM superfamily enzyme YgiQ (UPF0313 family)